MIQKSSDTDPDIFNEAPFLDAKEACRLWPGRRLSLMSFYRYSSHDRGKLGVDNKKHVLETFMSAGHRFTTFPAILRFVDAVNRAPSRPAIPSESRRTSQRTSAKDQLGELLGAK